MTDRPYSHAPAADGHPFVASFLAGPIFMIGLGIGQFLADPQVVIAPDSRAWILIVLLFNPLTVVIGALLAMPPVLLGRAAMFRLGAGNPAMQWPVAWALAGGLIGGGIATAVSPATTGAIVALTFTGTLGAVICRHGVRRDLDETPPL